MLSSNQIFPNEEILFLLKRTKNSFIWESDAGLMKLQIGVI